MKVMPSKVSPSNPKSAQETSRHTSAQETSRHTSEKEKQKQKEKEELFSQFDQSELEEWESLGIFVSPETLDFGYDGR